MLQSFAPGIAELARQRTQLIGALTALNRLSTVTVHTLEASKTDMLADLRELAPVLSQLAASGSALPQSLQVLLTYPFTDGAVQAIKGDYLNTFVTTDLNTPGGRHVGVTGVHGGRHDGHAGELAAARAAAADQLGRAGPAGNPHAGTGREVGSALMLTRTVRIQLVAFVVIAVLGVTYVAVRYVGLASWFGDGGYTVQLELPYSGGIFTNAEVTYRGVPVGRVGDMRLTATGIEVDLHITSGRKISRDLSAVVADRSVIGEQYVDLRPHSSSGPYLASGSVIDSSNAQLPPPVQDLLLSADQLAHSVPIGSLQTVVSELYAATRGAGPELQRLITASKAFFADRLPASARDHRPDRVGTHRAGRAERRSRRRSRRSRPTSP